MVRVRVNVKVMVMVRVSVSVRVRVMVKVSVRVRYPAAARYPSCERDQNPDAKWSDTFTMPPPEELAVSVSHNWACNEVKFMVVKVMVVKVKHTQVGVRARIKS